MSIYLKLNKNIDINALLSSIQSLIHKHKNVADINDCVLCIDIKYVNQNNNDLIPKLTYKGDINEL